jgi:hypothetical protein
MEIARDGLPGEVTISLSGAPGYAEQRRTLALKPCGSREITVLPLVAAPRPVVLSVGSVAGLSSQQREPVRYARAGASEAVVLAAGAAAERDGKLEWSFKAEPGDYVFSFARDDYETITRRESISPGTDEYSVAGPGEGDWVPGKNLATLLRIKEAVAKEDFAGAQKMLATVSADSLGAASHLALLKSLRARCFGEREKIARGLFAEAMRSFAGKDYRGAADSFQAAAERFDGAGGGGGDRVRYAQHSGACRFNSFACRFLAAQTAAERNAAVKGLLSVGEIEGVANVLKRARGYTRLLSEGSRFLKMEEKMLHTDILRKGPIALPGGSP